MCPPVLGGCSLKKTFRQKYLKLSYYIDMSVLLENSPLVKLILSGISHPHGWVYRWHHFPLFHSCLRKQSVSLYNKENILLTRLLGHKILFLPLKNIIHIFAALCSNCYNFFCAYFFLLRASKNRQKTPSVLEANPRGLHVFSYLIRVVDVVSCRVDQSVKWSSWSVSHQLGIIGLNTGLETNKKQYCC